ncbi:MAG: hypothetical protein ACJ763_13205 [Bdellovibrionia bacterium]
MRKTSLAIYGILAVLVTGYTSSPSIQSPHHLTASRSLASEILLAHPADFAEPGGDLPAIGKWMLDSHGEIAHWLGMEFNSHRINEPINIIIRVKAADPESANRKLLSAASAAGFENRKGHSTGYSAYLNDGIVPQFDAMPDHAFSDAYYLLSNNHGRIFGPVLWQGSFLYVAAFSRESVHLIDKLLGKSAHMHIYSSFNQARDQFASQMARQGGATIAASVPLDNALPENPTDTTGDHDGQAILLDL